MYQAGKDLQQCPHLLGCIKTGFPHTIFPYGNNVARTRYMHEFGKWYICKEPQEYCILSHHHLWGFFPMYDCSPWFCMTVWLILYDCSPLYSICFEIRTTTINWTHSQVNMQLQSLWMWLSFLTKEGNCLPYWLSVPKSECQQWSNFSNWRLIK